MKKKIIYCLLTIMLCFIFTGCGDKNTDMDDILDDYNDSEQIDKKDDEEEEYNIKLYSDNTKMVFNFSNVYYITYYYSDDKITGLEYIYDCQDKSTAVYMETSLRANYESEDNIKSIERKGKYIIITFTEEEYKDDTVEEIKETYSYLEQVQKES